MHGYDTAKNNAETNSVQIQITAGKNMVSEKILGATAIFGGVLIGMIFGSKRFFRISEEIFI